MLFCANAWLIVEKSVSRTAALRGSLLFIIIENFSFLYDVVNPEMNCRRLPDEEGLYGKSDQTWELSVAAAMSAAPGSSHTSPAMSAAESAA